MTVTIDKELKNFLLQRSKEEKLYNVSALVRQLVLKEKRADEYGKKKEEDNK